MLYAADNGYTSSATAVRDAVDGEQLDMIHDDDEGVGSIDVEDGSTGAWLDEKATQINFAWWNLL